LNDPVGGIEQTVLKQWFTSENTTKYYYSEKGNRKIEEAMKSHRKQIFLTNSDLNMTIETHRINLVEENITHLQSRKTIPIQIFPDKIIVELDQSEF